MRRAFWFAILVLCMGIAVGCSGGKGPTAEDTAFEKQLADAAANNKNPPKTKNARPTPKDAPKLPAGEPGKTTG